MLTTEVVTQFYNWSITMSLFSRASENQINAGLAILRVIVGIIFVAHGGQKLFVFGMDGVAAGFAQMGMPMAGLLGPFVGLLEFFGGFALIAGLLTRLASLGLAGTMLVATLMVHAKNGFFNPSGIEFTFALLGSTLMLALAGAGSWSVDGLVAKRSSRKAADSPAARLRRAA